MKVCVEVRPVASVRDRSTCGGSQDGKGKGKGKSSSKGKGAGAFNAPWAYPGAAQPGAYGTGYASFGGASANVYGAGGAAAGGYAGYGQAQQSAGYQQYQYSPY